MTVKVEESSKTLWMRLGISRVEEKMIHEVVLRTYVLTMLCLMMYMQVPDRQRLR
jgi:hypothetical protein